MSPVVPLMFGAIAVRLADASFESFGQPYVS